MKIRALIATAALAGFAIGSTAAADTTQQRLIDYGFVAPEVGTTHVVETRPVEAVSPTQAALVRSGFIAPPTEEVSRSVLVRQERVDRTGTEARLESHGFLPKQLGYSTEFSAERSERLLGGDAR